MDFGSLICRPPVRHLMWVAEAAKNTTPAGVLLWSEVKGEINKYLSLLLLAHVLYRKISLSSDVIYINCSYGPSDDSGF